MSSLLDAFEADMKFRRSATPNGVVRHRHLAQYFRSYERWRRRNVWWRRIPRNAVHQMSRAIAAAFNGRRRP